MAKYLKDILKAAHDTIKGVRPSETSTLSIGKDPGVDYKPKADDEADFIAKHSVQKWGDPAGNPNFADKVSHALTSPKEKLHGNTLPKAKAANEEVEQVDEAGMPASVIKSKQNRANMSDKEFADSHKDKSDADLRSMAWRHGHGKPGTPGHDHYVNRRNKGIKEEVEQIDELSTDLLHRAAHKAAKRAMGDAQGRSGPIFKKYAGMANKFRDKGMSQEKKEKAAKAVKEETDPGFSESKKAEDVLCNSTSQGTECPVHGMAECMSARPLKEISTKLALSYAKGASKSMDTAAAKGSAGHETFMKRSAGHKLALDKTNPEHKRLKAEVGTTDANAKDAAYKKSIGEEIVDEAMTVKQKQFSNRVKTMPGKKGAVMGATSNFEAPFHKVHATISKDGGAKETVKHEIKAKDKHDAIFDVQMMHHKAGHKIHDVKHKGMVKEEIDPGVCESKDEGGPVAPVPQHLDSHGIAKKYKDYVTGGGSTETSRRYNSHVSTHAKKTGQHTDAINKEVRKHVKNMKEETVEEGAKVDRFVKHVKSSEKNAGESDKKAENIAWATANKRGMLDNKNKKVEEAYAVEPLLGCDQPPSGDSDEAAEMVKTELKALANKAMHLVIQMPDSMHVEPWCQAKIAQAKAYVNDVHDYMVYGEHDKEEEDEGTTDTPLTLPNMSVDVNTGQNV